MQVTLQCGEGSTLRSTVLSFLFGTRKTLGTPLPVEPSLELSWLQEMERKPPLELPLPVYYVYVVWKYTVNIWSTVEGGIMHTVFV